MSFRGSRRVGFLLGFSTVLSAQAAQSLLNGSFEDGTNDGWIVWAQSWSVGPTWYHDPPGQTDVCGHNLSAPDGQYFGGISYLLNTTPAAHGHVLYRQAIEVQNWSPEADRTNFHLELWAQLAHSRNWDGYEPRQEHLIWWAPDGEMPRDTAFVRIGGSVAEGDTVEIDTGGVLRVYEFDTDSALRDPGNVPVSLAAMDVNTAKAALADAINDDASAPCTATVGDKTVVLLWKQTDAQGAANSNLNDTNNVIEVTGFSHLPGTPQYETNQNRNYMEDVPMRSVMLTHVKTPFFMKGVTQNFENWRKFVTAGSIPDNPKVVVLEIRLKTDARLEQVHNLFDGVVFSVAASTGSQIGSFAGDIANSDFEIEPYNTRHHGDKTGVNYDPPAGWGDLVEPSPAGYRNYLRDWGRDGALRGPIEGYTNGVTSPTDPLGTVTPSGEHFWGRANPGAEGATPENPASYLQGWWGHVVPVRNWSPKATRLRYVLRYLTLMTDLGGSARQTMELAWGDEAVPQIPGPPKINGTRSILEQPSDAMNFDLIQSYAFPWMKILDLSDDVISERSAVQGFVEIERTGEFSPTDTDGNPYAPQYVLLRNNTIANASNGTLPFNLFYDRVDFYVEAVPGCGEMRPDQDGDGDVDQEDFGLVQACLTGAPGGIPQGIECVCADLDRDNVTIGTADLTMFEACASGPTIPADPACDRQACCLPLIGCRDLHPVECVHRDGTPQGEHTSCASDPCAQP
jgi:hypothetical protein